MSDTDTQYTTVDLVNYALSGDALKTANALDALLGPKIVDAIQAKKVEVAQSVYGTPPEASAEDQEQQSEPSEEEGSTETEADADTSADAETEEENENA